jgi:hypothetical protein
VTPLMRSFVPLLLLALAPVSGRAQGDTARPPSPDSAARAATVAESARRVVTRPAAPAPVDSTRARELAAAAARQRTISTVADIAVGLLLAAGAVVFLVLAVRRAAAGGSFGVDSHWGGFGGGLGGWRISPPLAYLLAGLALALILAVFARGVAKPPAGDRREDPASRPAATP